MEDTMGNEGINRLAGVLQSRMGQMGDRPQVLDFGVIQGDMSLLTNRFPKPIPQKDYMVCRQVTLGPTHNILAKTQDMGMPHSGSQGKQPVPHRTRPSHRREPLAGIVRTGCTSTMS